MVEEGAQQLNVQLVLLGFAVLGVQIDGKLASGATHFLAGTAHNISTSLCVPSGFLVVFVKPNRSSFTYSIYATQQPGELSGMGGDFKLAMPEPGRECSP
jgi:hypothetical protein